MRSRTLPAWPVASVILAVSALPGCDGHALSEPYDIPNMLTVDGVVYRASIESNEQMLGVRVDIANENDSTVVLDVGCFVIVAYGEAPSESTEVVWESPCRTGSFELKIRAHEHAFVSPQVSRRASGWLPPPGDYHLAVRLDATSLEKRLLYAGRTTIPAGER